MSGFFFAHLAAVRFDPRMPKVGTPHVGTRIGKILRQLAKAKSDLEKNNEAEKMTQPHIFMMTGAVDVFTSTQNSTFDRRTVTELKGSLYAQARRRDASSFEIEEDGRAFLARGCGGRGCRCASFVDREGESPPALDSAPAGEKTNS